MRERPYQKECNLAIKTDLKNGMRKLLVVVGVSGGKSVIIAHLTKNLLAENPKGRVIMLVHRKELLEQNRQKLLRVCPELEGATGIEKAKQRCCPYDRVMLASNLTVGKEGIPRVKEWCPDLSQITAIITDEAHHVPKSKSYTAVIEEVTKANPACAIIGFTGTPKRADGERLDKVFTKLSYVKDMYDLWRDKYIVGIRGWKIKTQTSLEGLATKRRDFELDKLEERVNEIQRNQQAVDLYKDRHLGEQSLFFCVGKQHARDLHELMQKNSISSEVVTEDTAEEKRAEIVARFRKGKFHVLINCMVFTEGFDAPEVRAIFLLRPTKSPSLIVQMFGRGVRPICYPNPVDPEGEWIIDWEAKKECHVYDFVDIQAGKLGAQSITSVVGLHGEFAVNGEDIFETKAEIEAAVEEHPLMEEAIRSAKSKEDLNQILEAHDFLQELRMISYTEEADFGWAIIGEEFWLQLAQGETTKLKQTPLGNWELHIPELQIGKREGEEAKWRNRQKTEQLRLLGEKEETPETKEKIDEAKIAAKETLTLRAETKEEAIQEASQIIANRVPSDVQLLDRNAKWRTKAAKMPPTDGQIRALRAMGTPTQAIRGLNKQTASEWIDRWKMREKVWENQGRLLEGQYKGVEGHLVAIFDPDYWRLLKRPGRLAEKNEAAIKKVDRQEITEWLAENHGRIFENHFRTQAEMLRVLWNVNRPGAFLLTRAIWESTSEKTWQKVRQQLARKN